MFQRGPIDPGSTKSVFLAQMRAGDQDAWRRFCTVYGPWIYRACRRTGLAGPDAAEVMQTVIGKLYCKLDLYDASKGSFRGWIKVVAQNEALDEIERRARRPRSVGGSDFQQRLAEVPADFSSVASVSDAPPVEDAWSMRGLARRALERIAATIEPTTLQAFLGMIEGESAAEVGAKLGMRANAVRRAKARVLARLRQELGEAMAMPED